MITVVVCVRKRVRLKERKRERNGQTARLTLAVLEYAASVRVTDAPKDRPSTATLSEDT